MNNPAPVDSAIHLSNNRYLVPPLLGTMLLCCRLALWVSLFTQRIRLFFFPCVVDHPAILAIHTNQLIQTALPRGPFIDVVVHVQVGPTSSWKWNTLGVNLNCDQAVLLSFFWLSSCSTYPRAPQPAIRRSFFFREERRGFQKKKVRRTAWSRAIRRLRPWQLLNLLQKAITWSSFFPNYISVIRPIRKFCAVLL